MAENPQIMDRVPPTDDVASLPRKERRSAKKIADFFCENYNKANTLRSPHAESWLKTASILRGQHYFRVRYGVLAPIAKRSPMDIRAQVPVMEPAFRVELGRLNSNKVGITCLPRLGARPNAGYKAASAQAIMEDWLDESCFEETFDESNQHLLMWGGFAYYRCIGAYTSMMQTGYNSGDGGVRQQTVNVEAVGQPELYPVPFDSISPRTCDGIQRVKIVTAQWLEQQDEIYKSENGRQRDKRLSSFAEQQSISLSTRSAGISSTSLYGERIEGAVARWIWMKPSDIAPQGETLFMLGDELVGYQPTLPIGGFPLEFAFYTKRPNTFWGRSFCAPIISPQLEANRQYTEEIKAARFNKPFIIVDPEMVDMKDAQFSANAVVSAKKGVLGDEKRQPMWHVPAVPQGRSVSAALSMALQFARDGAGHHSDIVYGGQEGRTEGGPATSLLNNNAQAPLLPVVKRMRLAQQKTFPAVLDMLAAVWPQKKLVRTAGPYNLGREILITKDQVPRSTDIILIPAPLLPDGTNTLISTLFQMRELKGDDGNRPMLTEREFRRSMLHMGIAPPGIDMIDPKEDAVMYRIMSLIGDGKQPMARTVDQFDELEWNAFQAQPHRMFIEMLTAKIGEPAFEVYSPQVRKALLDELEAHTKAHQGIAANEFDDADQIADAQQMERYMYASEMDDDTEELMNNLLAQEG